MESSRHEFLNIISADIYRHNPFRIAKLDIRSPNKDIKRILNKTRVAVANNKYQDTSGNITVIMPPPDNKAIVQAIDYLANPEKRFIYEFFWFWPEKIEDYSDEALEYLIDFNDQETAKGIWINNIDQNPVAAHNLAIYNHLLALDNEYVNQNGKLNGSALKRTESYWNSAYNYWNTLISNDVFRKQMEQRIKQINDPTLNINFVNELFSILPEYLLSINAHFVYKAVYNKNQAIEKDLSFSSIDVEIQRHIRIMRSSGFPDNLVNSVLQDSMMPIIDDVKFKLNNIDSKNQDRPQNGVNVLENNIGKIELQLESLGMILPDNNFHYKNIRDDAAQIILFGVNGFLNTLIERDPITGEAIPRMDSDVLPQLKISMDLLNKARNIAASNAMINNINNSIENIKPILELLDILNPGRGLDIHNEPNKPVHEDIKLLNEILDRISNEVKNNPERALQILSNEMGEIRRLLDKIDKNVDYNLRNRIHDDTAMVILITVDTYLSKLIALDPATGEPKSKMPSLDTLLPQLKLSLKLLKDGQEIAATPDTKDRFNEPLGALETMINIIKPIRDPEPGLYDKCWFCNTRSPNESSSAYVKMNKYGDEKLIPVPRCTTCESAHTGKPMPIVSKTGGLGSFIGLMGGIWVGITYGGYLWASVIVLPLVLSFIFALVGAYYAETQKRKENIPNESSKYNFPPVLEAERDGYKF